MRLELFKETIMKRTFVSFVLLLAIMMLAASAGEAQLVPVGGEILVNTITAGSQFHPDVAMDNAGNYVVVWSSGPSGDADIFARRFDASGAPLESEFQVNTFTSFNQDNPRIGMDADGDFIVAWMSRSQFPPASASIVGQRYDKTGAPVGGEFQISTGLTTIFLDVAMSANGDFLVTFNGRPAGTSAANDLYARIYDSTGAPKTSPFVVYPRQIPVTDFPSVTSTPDGSWILAWSGNPSGPNIDILAQRFDADGNLIGPQVVVPDPVNAFRTDACVAASNDRIVASWTTGSRSVHARLFDGGLAPLTGDSLISTLPGVRTQLPACAMDGAGSFVISWTEVNDTIPSRDGSGSTILARLFAPDGNPVGAELVVNTTAPGSQGSSELAMSPDGRLAVVWRGPGPDESSDIFVQLYGTPATVLADLIEFIESLGLGGVGDALIAKLEAASASLAAGNTTAASNQLNAFQNQVEAQAGQKINPEDAELLLQAVDDLIASLEG